MRERAQIYHKGHFACKQCTKVLDSTNFFEREGQPFCDQCFNEVYVPKCAYCDGGIGEIYITALGKTWHMDHFFCSQCGKSFPNGNAPVRGAGMEGGTDAPAG